MQEAPAVEELARDPASRRRFLKAVGGSGAAGALALLISACGSKGKTQTTPGGSNPNTGAGVGTDQYGKGDVGIVRYALTVEYIENDFYAAAVQSGKVKGRASDLFKRFGAQEAQHVKALEAAVRRLGSQPPAKPKAQFTLGTQQSILTTGLGIEGLGAAALLGQADRIQDKQLLAAALSIHSVEGRHAAALASLLGQDPSPQGAFAQPTNPLDVLTQLHSLTAA